VLKIKKTIACHLKMPLFIVVPKSGNGYEVEIKLEYRFQWVVFTCRCVKDEKYKLNK
jgi:hypothetical protein